MFDTWSNNNENKQKKKNVEQTSTWSLIQVCFVWFSYSIFIQPQTRQRFCFSCEALWQGARNTDKEKKHLKPTSYTNTLLSTTTQKKKRKKKRYLHSSHSCFFLDLNFKHTSIASTAHFSNLHCPFGYNYSLLLLKALVPAVLKKNPQSGRLGRIIRQAQIYVLYKLLFNHLPWIAAQIAFSFFNRQVWKKCVLPKAPTQFWHWWQRFEHLYELDSAKTLGRNTSVLCCCLPYTQMIWQDCKHTQHLKVVLNLGTFQLFRPSFY